MRGTFIEDLKEEVVVYLHKLIHFLRKILVKVSGGSWSSNSLTCLRKYLFFDCEVIISSQVKNLLSYIRSSVSRVDSSILMSVLSSHQKQEKEILGDLSSFESVWKQYLILSVSTSSIGNCEGNLSPESLECLGGCSKIRSQLIKISRDQGKQWIPPHML